MSDEGFWCPILIDGWRIFIGRGIKTDGVLENRHAFKSNIGYTLQHLEFLDHQINNENLHSTIYSQTLKSFIISGMGIIEAICWYLLKKNGCQKKQEWEIVSEQAMNPFDVGEQSYRSVNRIEKKLDEPVDSESSLQWMIRRVEKKKLLGMDSQVYKDLNYLRGLRNRVHIHVVQHDSDTDWHSFNRNEYKLMKKALYGVFTSEMFNPEDRHKDMLNFLLVKEKTINLLEG